MARVLTTTDADFSAQYERLLAERGERLDKAEEIARVIVQDVRARGVAAILDYTAKFEGLSFKESDLCATDAEINAAVAACPRDLIAALEQAAERIEAFHKRERPQDGQFTDAQGVTLGWRWTPVDAAGLYAPGGIAAYPSSVLMNAIPAKAAGVPRVAMATPPGQLNANPAILAAAKIAGVTEIWKIGGAQAIAALAYGAGALQPTDVVVGPGNAYVAAAKRVVFGSVGVDAVAGPSEVFIFCDCSVDPKWIAADLMAQAEHDADAQSVLFTTDASFGAKVAEAVSALLSANELPLHPWTRVSWEKHGAVVVTRSEDEAAELINRAAPEHVQLAMAAPEGLAAKIRHAGALFLGAHSPEALGDYVAGPSHVLPTVRSARFASGISTFTFMKRTSLIAADAKAVAAIGPAAARIADAEGLPAHALSVRLRLAPKDP